MGICRYHVFKRIFSVFIKERRHDRLLLATKPADMQSFIYILHPMRENNQAVPVICSFSTTLHVLHKSQAGDLGVTTWWQTTWIVASARQPFTHK